MATISSTLALNDKISGTLRTITNAMSSTLGAMRTIKGIDIGEEFAQASADIKLAERALESLEIEMSSFSSAPSKAGDGFTIMKGLAVSAFTAISGAIKNSIGDVIGLVDQTTTQAARLSMVNDGLQTQAQLQNQIFQAAQRSRSEYGLMMDSVAKLNLLAGDAFSTNREAVAYAELLSKSFKIAGTDTMAQVGATRQLIQALGSGALRGDELNSVFEAAPNLIRNIADYLEVPIGQIRDMAGDGELTADIIKASMFAAADDINSKFAEMPMTIAEIGTVTGNVLLRAFTPALQAIGEGARYIYDNWESIAPIFVGVASGITGAAVAWGVYTAAQWLATGGLTAFMLTLSPVLPIILAIGLTIGFVVGEIYKWVQAVGGMEIAWDTAVSGITYGMDQLGIFVSMIGSGFIFAFDNMGLGVLKFSTGVQNYLGGMKVAALTIIQSMVNGAIGLINDLINTVNNIPGVAFEPIGAVTFAASEAVQYESEKQQRNAQVAAVESGIAERDAARRSEREKAALDAELAGYIRSSEIQQRQTLSQMGVGATVGVMDPLAAYSTSASGGGKALKTAEQNKLITDEDIKLLADVATRDYQLNYKQITPSVSFGDMYITNEVDADGVIEKLASAMEEMSASDLVVA